MERQTFSIGEAIDTFERMNREQREIERSEAPHRDALDDYAAILSSASHPPNECGDPFDCPIHSEQIRDYQIAKEN